MRAELGGIQTQLIGLVRLAILTAKIALVQQLTIVPIVMRTQTFRGR
jgi:hypothetical protein